MEPVPDAAFAEFMAAHHHALIRTAFLLVGDRGHAEDLVSSALYKTFAAWPRLRAPAAAEAYTRTTLIRLAGRWRRRRWHGELPTADAAVAAAVRDASEGVNTALDVHRALGALPWSQRAVLLLRYFDDLSEVRTAELLGCSAGTVKSRASRGLTALRTASLLTVDATAVPSHQEVTDG